MNKIKIEDHIKYKRKIKAMGFIVYRYTEITSSIDTNTEFADEGLKFDRIVTNETNSFIHFFNKAGILVLGINNVVNKGGNYE